MYAQSKENCQVVKSTDTHLFDALKYISEYMPLSGREVRYGAEKAYASCQSGCLWGVEVKDVVTFVWRCGEHTLYYLPEALLTPELLQFWVLHTILPMMLTLEKCYDILHVGAVEVDGKPIVFAAESFGGKSTMTDYFLQRGHTLLSDDTLGIYERDGIFMAVPSYPFHRPYREPESLGYKVDTAVCGPKPIHALFLLEKSDAEADVVIEELKGIEKYKAFHFSTFISFDFLKDYRFNLLSKMANTIPVHRVKVPWEITRLDDVYHEIIIYMTENTISTS